jgi:hypothetical protein
MSAVASTARRRGLAGALDQVFSSLSNGLILYAIAVVSTAQYFGRISLLLTLLAAAVGCMRGALGTPLLLKASHGSDEVRREGSYAVTAALLISPLLAGAMWLLEGREIGTPTILVAIATPLVMVQDVLRYIVISEGRPHVAAIWDGVWFVGSLGLLVSTWFGAQFVDVNVLIAGWSVLAAAALIGLAINLRLVVPFRGFFSWLRTDWKHRLRYGIDAGLEQSGVFVALALVALFISPVATAALRGATALLAPLAILTSALPLIVIPESKRRSATPQQVWRGLTKITALASAATVIGGVVLFLLPNNIGQLLLGNTFGLTQNIILITTVEYAIGLWCIAVTVYLKTFNRSAELLTVKICYASSGIGLITAGALLFKSATGAAVGLAIASTLITTVSLAWFTPWRAPKAEAETKPDFVDVDVDSTERLPRPTSSPLWKRKVIEASRSVPRPLPDFVQVQAYSNAAAKVSSPLIALWCFLVLGVIGPMLVIQITGPAPNLTWWGPLAIALVAAARFSWIVGSGERRLFEVIFWTFTYAFMGLAPVAQIRERTWPITTYRMDSTLVWAGTAIAATATLAFFAGVMAHRTTRYRRVSIRPTSAGPGASVESGVSRPLFTVSEKRVVILAVLAVLLNLYFLSKIGWILFTQSRRATIETNEGAFSSTAMSAFIRAGTYMSLLVAFLALVRFRKEAKRAALLGHPQSAAAMRLNLVLIIVIGLLTANTLNPISTARYLSGTAILAVAASFGLFATVARFRAIALGFIAALLVLFPMMDAFRFSFSAENLNFVDPIESFLSPDYDSFAQIMNGYMIAEREGLHVGRQLVGVLLFWVPRAMWPQKPLDTGLYLADSRGYLVGNLSAPLPIEIYMNGGFILVVLVMFAAGYLVHAWDTKIENQLTMLSMPGILGCIFPFYSLILLRGSLLQAMPYLFTTVACWLFVRSRTTGTAPRTAKPRGPSRPIRIKPPERQPANV